MNGFTPGPWDRREFDDTVELWNWDARPEFPVCVIDRHKNYEADLGIIAAAPDLLAYCECSEIVERHWESSNHTQMLDELGRYGFTGREAADSMEALRKFLNDMRRAAITKATT